MNMSCVTDLAETSALYAGFAASFRYPEEAGNWLSGHEFLDAFDPGTNPAATPLSEAAYADIDTSALFEELVRYYEHFGLRRCETAALPDHLSVELEFMHFLCELQLVAAARGENTDPVRKAQQDFIDRHVRHLLDGVLKGLLGKGIDHEDKAVLLVRECLEFVEEHRGMFTD